MRRDVTQDQKGITRSSVGNAMARNFPIDKVLVVGPPPDNLLDAVLATLARVFRRPLRRS